MRDGAQTFEITVEFFCSKAKLGDGSLKMNGTKVKWLVEFSDIDPQDLQNTEEKAVQNLVEKIGAHIVWGPDQEISLLRFDNWKGEYVRIENGEEMVDGWTTKQVTFYAELVDLNFDSKVGYVASKLASQHADDEWASQRQIIPILTEVTLLADSVDAVAQEGAPKVVYVDWNSVEVGDVSAASHEGGGDEGAAIGDVAAMRLPPFSSPEEGVDVQGQGGAAFAIAGQEGEAVVGGGAGAHGGVPPPRQPRGRAGPAPPGGTLLPKSPADGQCYGVPDVGHRCQQLHRAGQRRGVGGRLDRQGGVDLGFICFYF
jgi:hypothetical protein